MNKIQTDKIFYATQALRDKMTREIFDLKSNYLRAEFMKEEPQKNDKSIVSRIRQLSDNSDRIVRIMKTIYDDEKTDNRLDSMKNLYREYKNDYNVFSHIYEYCKNKSNNINPAIEIITKKGQIEVLELPTELPTQKLPTKKLKDVKSSDDKSKGCVIS